MAYIFGTGELTTEASTTSSDVGTRSKTVTSTGSMTAKESSLYGDGLGYTPGEILSFISHLAVKEATLSGTGTVDSFAYIPKININAKFNIDPTLITARFPIG